MPPRLSKKSRPKQSPSKLAAQCVDEWYDSLLQSSESLMVGSVFQVTLESAFNKVLQSCLQMHIAEHGPITEDVEGATEQICAQEAGYLIGVQVGLRLRLGGGVR
jgi:hypothetical protein